MRALGGLHDTAGPSAPATGALGRLLRRAALGSQRVRIGGQRRRWSRRASSWHAGGDQNAGLNRVRQVLLTAASERPGELAVDLGCGSGEVSVPLGRHFRRVVAVDVSPEMIALLEARAVAAGAVHVQGLERAIERLRLPVDCADLVVSNYALHHLHDADKARLVERAATWLRPGGRLLIADMMLGRGADPHDRAIIRDKLAVLVRRGPGGWWRIAKNLPRFLLRLQERPISPAAWCRLLEQAGFHEVRHTHIVAEAGMVVGTKAVTNDG